MKQRFSKSWSFRKNALFSEIDSRGYELYFNNRWSKISSEEKYWLIVFTKPLSLSFDETTPEKERWYSRFWVWNSASNKIMGENRLSSVSYKGIGGSIYNTNIERCQILEAYIYNNNIVVIKPNYYGVCLLYDLKGQLIVQTQPINVANDDHELKQTFSWFINEHTLFCKENSSLSLYKLDKLDGYFPEEIRFYGLSEAKFFPNNYNFYLNESYFAFYAQEDSPEASCYLSTLFIYRIDKRNWAHFVTKFISVDGMIDLSLQSTDNYLEISYKKEIRKESNDYCISDPIVIRLPNSILA